jgi:hypothetical protein
MRAGPVTIGAAVIVGLILVKDGTMQALIGNVATAAKTFAGGIKPITTIA